jgi:hypothetical protein
MCAAGFSSHLEETETNESNKLILKQDDFIPPFLIGKSDE